MVQFCRTCLEEVDQNYINLSNTSRKELTFCVPEMDVDMVANPTMCMCCINALHSAYDFKLKCLRTDEKIRSYMQDVSVDTKSVFLDQIIPNHPLTVTINDAETLLGKPVTFECDEMNAANNLCDDVHRHTETEVFLGVIDEQICIKQEPLSPADGSDNVRFETDCIKSNEDNTFDIKRKPKAEKNLQCHICGSHKEKFSVKVNTKKLASVPKGSRVHTLIKSEGPAMKTRRRCVNCYAKIKRERGKKDADSKTKKVTTYCNDCDFKPSLCIPCFNETHSKIVF